MFRICKGKAEYYNSMFYEMSSFAKNYLCLLYTSDAADEL